MMTQESIVKLVNGDTQAFCAFYEAYAPTVYQKILAQTSDAAKAKQMLKDVFSECCLRMRNAGAKADPTAILLEVICDEKLRADAAKPETPLPTPPMTETAAPAEEFAASELKPEEVVRIYSDSPTAEKPTDPAPVAPVVPIQSVSEPEAVSEEKPAPSVDLRSDRPKPKIVLEPEPEDEPAEEEFWNNKQEKHLSGWWIVLTVLLGIIFLILVWGVVGVLSADGLIPKLNLGYDWFNEHIVSFF